MLASNANSSRQAVMTVSTSGHRCFSLLFQIVLLLAVAFWHGRGIPIDNGLVTIAVPGGPLQKRIECKPSETDLLLIVDGSSSITAPNFELVRQFLASLLSDLEDTKTRVAVIQFASNVRTEFPFSTYRTIAQIQNAIRTMPYLMGTTKTGAALQFALRSELIPERGDRPDAEDIVIVITDGRAQDDPGPPAQLIRATGAKVIAVGVTDQVNDQQLLDISGSPDRTFKIENFRQLDEGLKNQLTTAQFCREVFDYADNETVPLFVQCNSDSIVLRGQTRNPFEGQVYVRGYFNNSECKTTGDGQSHVAEIVLPFTTCGLTRKRSLNPRGVLIDTTIVFKFHQKFQTKVDRVFVVQCFYMESDKTVSQDFEVSAFTTGQLISDQYPMPVCQYTLHSGTLNGPIVHFAQIGDALVHKWECTSVPAAQGLFAMKVHTCYVDNGSGNRVLVLGEDGCSLDRYVMQNLNYDRGGMLAYVEAHAFAFRDLAALHFQCQVSLCYKPEGGCANTPPNCTAPTQGRRRRGFITMALDDERVVDVDTAYLQVLDISMITENTSFARIRPRNKNDAVALRRGPPSESEDIGVRRKQASTRFQEQEPLTTATPTAVQQDQHSFVYYAVKSSLLHGAPVCVSQTDFFVVMGLILLLIITGCTGAVAYVTKKGKEKAERWRRLSEILGPTFDKPVVPTVPSTPAHVVRGNIAPAVSRSPSKCSDISQVGMISKTTHETETMSTKNAGMSSKVSMTPDLDRLRRIVEANQKPKNNGQASQQPSNANANKATTGGADKNAGKVKTVDPSASRQVSRNPSISSRTTCASTASTNFHYYHSNHARAGSNSSFLRL